VEVSLRVQDDLGTVHIQDSNKYAGLLDHVTGRTLGQLTHKHVVDFAAFISVHVTSTPKSRKEADPVQSKLHIVIYGLEEDGETIGCLLSTNGLYLQHPRRYDLSKKYSNPHYLARPGRENHLLAYTALEGYLNFPPDAPVLDEVDKGRILQVFDCAQGPETFSELQLSSSLKTELKSYVIISFLNVQSSPPQPRRFSSIRICLRNLANPATVIRERPSYSCLRRKME
jgi:hypothetical protein